MNALLNDEYFVKVSLKYDLANIFESDLYAILFELNKDILPSPTDIPEQISNRLFNLISNRISIKKKPLGLIITPKTE